MREFRWALGWVGKITKMIASIMMGLVSILVMTIVPFFFKNIIDDVLMGRQYDRLIPLLATVLAGTIAQVVFRYGANILMESVSQDVTIGIREKLFSHILDQTAAFHRENDAGSLITYCTGDTDMVRHFICWVIPRATDCIGMMIMVLIIFTSINPLYALCLFTLTPVSAFLAFQLGKEIRPAHTEARESRRRLSTVVTENISGNRVVKAFTRESHEIGRFEDKNTDFRNAQVGTNKVWLRFQPFIELVAQSLGVINLVVGAILVIKGQITLGQMNIFQSLAWALNEPMLMIGIIVNDTSRFLASSEKLMNIQFSYNAIKSPADPVPVPDMAGDVQMRGVSLRIGGMTLLDNVNLTINRGQTVGFMGHTGSGKTLLASMIPRFIDASEGEVLIDGVNVKDFDLRELRSQIGMAMQDVFMFSDSVENNVAYGNPAAPMEAVIAAADLADADGFIKHLPQGYDTIIGERGVGLSGGQKQRLSLARALLPDPSILILDDTTSSVDMETEKIIQNNLNNMETKATKIIIAQRVSSIKNADRIYILDSGRVIEEGTHAELMANNGYYYETCVLQQLTYSENDQEGSV